jgi:phage shock protein PspC (stress-responsive transcriptional regulator)
VIYSEQHVTKKESKPNMNKSYNLLLYFQKRGYYVCQRIADRLGIRAKIVRTSFMYLTFVTVGFGFALYVFLAFWMRIKDIIYTKRSSVFDL